MTWTLPDIEDRTLGKVLRHQAEAIGDHPYLMDGTDRFSFSQANRHANSFAAVLRKRGVTRGDGVACYLDNSAEVIFLSLALAKLGAAFIPTCVDFKRDFLLRTFTQGGSDVLVVDEDLVSRVAEIWDRYTFKHVLVRGDPTEARLLLRGASVEAFDVGGEDGSKEPPEVEDVRFSDISAVMWTSGTTGPPKGVMQSHHLWLVDSDLMVRKRSGQEGDVFYNTLPMYQSGAWLMNIYAGLVSGCAVALDPRFSVSEFWDRCRFYGATQMFTLGAMHMYLWQAAQQPDDRDNPIRVASCIPMPSGIHEPFRDRFGIDFIFQAFGQSECMPWSTTDPSRPWKPDSAGAAREDLEIKILDDEDREVPPGETGEVCIRPRQPHVIFSGFYHDPDATVKAWRNLWYHSGDLGRIDEDGEFFFVDRKADFMRHKGRNISSFEVESVAARHPAVLEVAAHTLPADELEVEDEIKLCVVLREGVTVPPEALAVFINENAPHYMVPRFIEFLDELPHTPTGRVQKYKLRCSGITARTWDRHKAGFAVTR